MPLIETTGSASAKALGLNSASQQLNYIEDVFSTYLYTGNSTSGGTQTITNNIDLSTKGGMVWIKGRSAASDHILSDTARGAGASATNNNALASNLASAEDLGGSSYDFLSAFNADGFTVKQGGTTTATRGTNYNNVTYTSWTFRKQPKFFDIVTWTGNDTSRAISHSLGSVPGCILVKRVDGAGSYSWIVWHRAYNSGNGYAYLNLTNAFAVDNGFWWGNGSTYTAPTSTNFTISGEPAINQSGVNYVAYLFAHDAGGFGLTGTDNVISCGSYTGNGTSQTINLGYEPQWILTRATSVDNWVMLDNMRGIATGGVDARLYANSANAEDNTTNWVSLNATGYTLPSGTLNGSGSTYIYIAIRRGPMKTPTSGTSVYKAITRTGNGVETTVTGAGFPVDFAMTMNRDGVADKMGVIDRLRNDLALLTAATNAEAATWFPTSCFAQQDGIVVGTTRVSNGNAETYVNQFLRRAPSFMDVVCYTGTGSNTTVTHNLGVAPELMIVKRRSTTNAWAVYANNDNTDYLVLNTSAATVDDNTYWNDTSPTSTVFSVGTNNAVNASGSTYVAYLFATCAGVSKVGSYTGSGTTKQIDCGFTGGARLVIIKRTDSTGDWYVWDTARGIVSGNDPYLLLNSTAAEVTNTDYVDTYSAGFEISSTAPAAINANGGTFIFLAIA